MKHSIACLSYFCAYLFFSTSSLNAHDHSHGEHVEWHHPNERVYAHYPWYHRDHVYFHGGYAYPHYYYGYPYYYYDPSYYYWADPAPAININVNIP